MRIRSNGWRARWPTLLAGSAGLSVALATCAKPEPLRPVTGEPDVRVGIAIGANQLRVGARGAVAALQDGRAVFRLMADPIFLAPAGRGMTVAGAAGSGQYETLSFAPLESSALVVVDGKPYRGVVEVFARGGGLTAVNQVALEAYVAGVVSAEMGRRTDAEHAALEAQAIVTRSYFLANRGKFAAEGYDLRATVTDQAYGGVDAETSEGWRAVRGTTGLMLTFDGEPVTPFYHSTCGGSTASPPESFRTVRARPYLRPVSDRRPGGGDYCNISPRYRWTVEWDGSQLRDILRRTAPAVLGIEASMVDQIRDIRVQRTGPSGRAVEVRVRVGHGEMPISGPDMRAALLQPDGRILGSTVLQLAANHGADGVVRRVTAHGAGWGHGVGMCQWGAVGRARAGQDFETILTTYFPGAIVERWY